MPNLKPYTGPTKLVIAFDIGAAYSGISYCILERGRVPEILGVTRFSAQELIRDDARIPSVVYYDQSGNVQAVGAEVLAEGKTETALQEGWTKAEWWKLHLRPGHLVPSVKPKDDLPPLPHGKSAVDVLTDFIAYLFQCAKTYIQERHLAFTWSSIKDSIEYIFTHPNGWEGVQQQLYRQAITRAGLIPSTPEGQRRVHMLTEGEASFHFCVSNLLGTGTIDEAAPRGIVIIDAGGGAIDLNMFSMTSNPISCEEIAPPEYRLQGSVFVTRRAGALLRRKLEGWEHSSADEIAEFTREFNMSTKVVIRSDQEPAYVRVARRRINNSKYNISSGKLKLSGKEATDLFNESIDTIIDAFEQQQKSATIPITTAFIFGGLSANNWLWSRLQSYFKARNINIYRPVDSIYKAVANGAVLSHVDRDNHTVASLRTAKSLCVQEESPNNKIAHLEQIVAELRATLADRTDETDRLKKTIESLRAILRTHEQKQQCELLYAQGRVIDAAKSLIQIATTASEVVKADKLIGGWLTEFTHRCMSTLEVTGDEASNINQHSEAIVAYSTALSLGDSIPNTVLIKWASSILTRSSADGALGAAAEFKLPKSVICHTICDVLEGDGRVTEAIACFRRMESELVEDTNSHDERVRWKLGFQRRCTERLGELCDAAMDSQNYDGAAEHLSTILSLNPVDRVDVLSKRSKARALMKSWEDALSDADEVIKLDTSCHRGYELRHAALHGAGLHAQAVEAFDAMLQKINESPGVDIRQLRRRYVDARPTIQRVVTQIIRPMPRVLIDTTTGRLYDKKKRAEAFEALPIYSELVSSMTAHLDRARILGEVKKFYRYVMLSHTWGHDEPLLQEVENISIYDLEASSANIKLQKFCSLVRSLGFRWAWSDTCCVDKSNNVVLQESLVAMFTWYRGSSLTVVYLRDVSSKSQLPGGLQGSIWNTRAWTYQEYVAAEIIRFYTEDWQPYLGLTLDNHKESPDIISEMRGAREVPAGEIATLRPGLDRVREKLYLASGRESALAEDIAYSLFGIFNVTIPVIYGEGNCAVGRLLEHILNGSRDVTVLAWTGSAGRYNSCLPADLTVYDQLVPLHVPRPMETAEMENIITELRSSLPDLSSATTLHDRLNELSSPSLGANRLTLPGIVFPLTGLLHAAESDSKTKLHAYRVTTPMFGDVEIKTADDLTGMKDLCFVHSWIHPLLDQEFSHGVAALDKMTRALRFVARLRQPFGALLFEPQSRIGYKRVATDSLIMAQIRKEVSLTELMDSIRTIEIQ